MEVQTSMFRTALIEPEKPTAPNCETLAVRPLNQILSQIPINNFLYLSFLTVGLLSL